MTKQAQSIEELEALLAEKKAEEKAALEKARKDYETHKDNLVSAMIFNAQTLNDHITRFKTEAHAKMNEQQEKLNSYGKIRGNSKGGFSIVHSDGTMRVTRIRSTEPIWDEKSTKAVDLISKFLRSTVKKRDIKMFEILISFLEKNDKGDLEYDKVMHLVKHEDKFEEPEWKEGLRLIKESYSVHLRAYGYNFEVRNPDSGKWEKIEVNFTAIKPIVDHTTQEELKN